MGLIMPCSGTKHSKSIAKELADHVSPNTSFVLLYNHFQAGQKEQNTSQASVKYKPEE